MVKPISESWRITSSSILWPTKCQSCRLVLCRSPFGFNESQVVNDPYLPSSVVKWIKCPITYINNIYIYIPREPITYEIIGRHAKPRLFCTFHQNPVYCVKTPGFPKNPNFWSEMLDMLSFWQNLALAFILDNNQTDAFQIY